MRMNRLLFSSFLLALAFITGICFAASEDAVSGHKVIMFYSSSCHECMRVENELLPGLIEEFRGKVAIDYRNIADINNYKLMLELAKEQAVKPGNTMPVFYSNGMFLSKKSLSRRDIRQFILNTADLAIAQPEGRPPQNLIEYFRKFKPATIAGAGLVDGINPCAFAVIVFFISFLALQGYRKRELLFIGLSFVSAVFLAYLLLGVGLLEFIYQFQGFWAVTKVLNYCIGALSVVLGILCIRDIIIFRATARYEDMVLQLPRIVKNQIHKVIGQRYRVNKSEDNTGPQAAAKGALGLMAGAFVTGLIVSILEAVCTGQMYLPVIAFVLKTTRLKLEAFGYLVLYNLMFIAPLVIILLLGLWGVSSGQFSRFMHKHITSMKILMALMFFALGMFLLLRA